MDLHIMGDELLAYCNSFAALNRRYTLPRRCLPNVPIYISIDHEHKNGIINSSLVGVIICDWKYYNHQGLCFNSKRSIRVGPAYHYEYHVWSYDIPALNIMNEKNRMVKRNEANEDESVENERM
ncbi:hypothetical protein H8356DRAFT_1426597 [Neocallimastix lanati (nom. inval.)]|nr:hypothetical protein H8356DRAFT_1426597 [Neocallimastix sp. JGI-2020a]